MANIAAELKAFYGTKTLRMCMGVVKPSTKKGATRVCVFNYELDKKLIAYFREQYEYYAFDATQKCKTGDIVLVGELPSKKTTLITHEIKKILFPLGDITCPLTGRKVVTKGIIPHYRDVLEKVDEVYGLSPNRFVYEKAPPRGWQEGKRDFSDKVIVKITHDEGVYDPYKEYY